MNGGSCSVNGIGQIVCQCLTGYSGAYCQFDQNANCNSNPCLNGANCTNQNSQGAPYTCRCLANYYGKNCQYQVTSQLCSAGDTNPSFCPVWKTFGFCSYTYTFNSVPVPIYCPTSCNLCRTVSSCTDSQANCAVWSNLGLCNTVSSIDPNLCKRSCGLCGSLTKKKK